MRNFFASGVSATSGLAVIGTPEMAAEQVSRLVEQSGGFGTYLFMGHDWADRQATLASYELFAREVMPRFQGSMPSLVDSRDWAAANREAFIGSAIEAITKAVTDHQAELGAQPAAGTA